MTAFLTPYLWDDDAAFLVSEVPFVVEDENGVKTAQIEDENGTKTATGTL